MTFHLIFKTPDVLEQISSTMSGECGAVNRELAAEAAKKFAEEYVKWGEYVTLQFDSVDRTVTVIKAKEME